MTISLVGILIFLIVVGLVLYLINMLPLDAMIKNIAYVVVVVFILLYLLQMLGGFGPGITIRGP